MTGKRIRLFISDIDGCLAEPFRSFDLKGLGMLRSLAKSARKQGGPLLTICSGRGFGYVEAIAQALAIDIPVLFEAGGGMYYPRSYSVRWSPESSKAERDTVRGLMDRWEIEYNADPEISIDIFKHTQASIVVQNPIRMKSILEKVQKEFEDEKGSMVVADTHCSIDVFPKHLSKRKGILWLAKELEIAPDEMAFIGDSTGDIGAIDLVGIGFAPSNGTDAVKASADRVCLGRHIDGVLEAFQFCIDHNQTIGVSS